MKKYKLNELYEISSGLSKSSSEFGFGNPFLSFSIVFNNFHMPKKLNELVNTNDIEIIKYSIKRGDVFVTRTSETYDELGKSCVALQDYPKATFNGFCKRLRPKFDDDLIIPEYAQYLFRSKSFINQIIYSSPMSTRASLNEEVLNLVELDIHDIEMQRHIIDIIGSIDDKISNNNMLIEKLLLLGDFIQSNDRRKIKFDCANLKFSYGKSIPKNNREKGQYDLYSSNGITDKINEANSFGPSIIFGCRGTIGPVFYSFDDCFILNTAMYLNCTDEEVGKYYFSIREKKGFKNEATGAVQLQITINEIDKTFIMISNDKRLNNILLYIDSIKKESKKLEELKQLYLKKFFE